MSELDDGWDDDDDLSDLGDDDDEMEAPDTAVKESEHTSSLAVPPHTSPVVGVTARDPPKSNTSLPFSQLNDGWDDDSDVLDEDIEINAPQQDGINVPPQASVEPSQPQQQPEARPSLPSSNHDNIVVRDDPPQSVAVNDLNDGWDDDLNDIGDGDEEDTPTMHHMSQEHHQPQEHAQQPQLMSIPPPPIYHELRQYFEILPHLTSSINALLEAEHNSNPEKAWEIVRYYEDRPGLVDYTLHKELPRMDYTWMDQYTGEPIQDKGIVSQLLLENAKTNSILPRCANQSLLADLLGYLSSSSSSSHNPHEPEDRLIRSKFHMACQTERVEFVLDPAHVTVLVKAVLNLCMPHPSQGMLSVATLSVSCQFAPNVPLWHYHLESIIPSDAVISAMNHESLALVEVAQFLQELNMMEEEHNSPTIPNDNNNRGGEWRDAFLQETTMGVWNQLKQAGRVSSETLSNHLSLPSGDLLEQARREEEDAQAAALLEQEQQRQQQQQEEQMRILHEQERVQERPPLPQETSHIYASAAGFEPSYPPAPPPPPQDDLQPMYQEATQPISTKTSDRPKSILGGMISRTAQSVTVLPQEDPSMYDEWRQQGQQKPPPLNRMPEWPGRLSQQEHYQTQRVLDPPDYSSSEQHQRLSSTMSPPQRLAETEAARPNTGLNPNSSPSQVHDSRHKSGDQDFGGVEPRRSPVPTVVGRTDQHSLDPPTTVASLARDPPEQHDADETAVEALDGPSRVDNDKNDQTSYDKYMTVQDTDGWENDDEDLLLLEEDNRKTAVLEEDNRKTAANPDDIEAPNIFGKDDLSRSKDFENGKSSNVESLNQTVVEVNISPETSIPTGALAKSNGNCNWAYDPETDIIPTRKRWINPRPGPRQLTQLLQ